MHESLQHISCQINFLIEKVGVLHFIKQNIDLNVEIWSRTRKIILTSCHVDKKRRVFTLGNI